MKDGETGILIVESDILVRSEIARFLRSCGYTVVEATSSDEALTILQKGVATLHCVMADVDDQGQSNGFHVAQWVRANRPEIDVILTGTTENTVEEAGELCEDGPVLKKPYDTQMLLDRIKQLIANRQR